ncbi:phage tail protein [Terasakiella sp.]|uniref:phage tail-collar fiber domain-containing protein n=1 Tax=Terasakiella sp. TaxID=2034861 RepID=UPI003AA95686
MSTVSLTPILTAAGLAAVSNADGNGLQAIIAEIAVGDAGYEPDGTETGLQNELARVDCSAGGAISPNSVLVEAMIAAGAPSFFIREIGFFLDDGTLLAVWSSEGQTVGYRSDLAPWFFKFVLGWESLPTDAITVNFNGDAQLAAMSLDLTLLEGKVRHTVESAGIDWDDQDDTQLTAAINFAVGRGPYDMPFNSGWGSDGAGEDIAVQGVGAVLVQRDLVALEIKGRLLIPATGADAEIDILNDGVSIFGEGQRPKFLDGETNLTAGVFLSDGELLDAGSVVEVKVLSVGSTSAGQKMLITIVARGR